MMPSPSSTVVLPSGQRTADDEELALILAALAERQKESPLEFLELLPGQQGFDESGANIILIFGGNRCLGGECEIYDPHRGEMRRIDSIDDDWFWVEAWDGEKKVNARAWRPFKKEVDDLYEVGLSNGQSFVASLNHLVLTPSGYLSIFDCLVKCGGVLLQTTSESCQSVQIQDEPCCSETVGGFRGGCHGSHCLCDERPLLVKDSVQLFSPLQGGALVHTCVVDDEQKDGSHNKLKYNRPYQLDVHLPIQDVLHQTWGQCVGTLYCASYKLYRLALGLLPNMHQSKIASFLLKSIIESALRDSRLRCASACNTSNNYLAVISLRLKRRDVKWDFTVPDYHNYFLGGVVHHNSGKTTPVSKKVLELGLKKRMKIWVCGETFQDSIAIQQKKISELVPRREIKYGTYDDINGFTNRKLQLKNGTLITFKSYDQGAGAFQSDDIDLIWNDEEPPLDIVKEQKMRLIDRNGRMIISMTSLKGITDFIRDYFEDCDILETRFAPLVKKELPVRGKKGNVDIFFLWTTDNRYIDQKRLMEDVALMPETDRMTRIYGMPTNLAGKIYMSFGRDTHVIPLDDAPTTGNQLWHVLDPHDRKPWAMGWYLVNKNGTVYCVDEYPNQNFNDMLYDDKTYEDYAKIIKEKEALLRSVFNCGGIIRRRVDPNFGNKTIQFAERKGGQSKTTPVKELAKLGLHYKDAIDTLEAGHLEVRKWLHFVKKGNLFVVAPGFVLTDNCENHIKGLTRYARKDIIGSDGEVKDKVSPQQTWKDFPDLVRYLLMANPRWVAETQWQPPKEKLY